MPLTAILGMCVFVACPHTLVVPTPRVAAALQSTQSQETSPSSSTQPGSTQQPTEPPKTPGESAAPEQTPASPATPCSDASNQGSSQPRCKPAEPSVSKSKKHRRTRKPAPVQGTGPTKTVVRHGSTSDPVVALSPSLSQQQVSQQLQKTNQLLTTTDANLRKIAGRQLSPGQQDTVTQIKSYMEQAKMAANNGDLQRAYNLATKANLLSADLVGP